jgi:hypothetical protein
MVRVAGVEPALTCAQDMWVAATLHPDYRGGLFSPLLFSLHADHLAQRVHHVDQIALCFHHRVDGLARPLPESLVARHGIEPCPPAFQTSTLPSSSRANLVDGARIELAFHGCRPWVIPLYEPPNWGEMRESNSRDWSHNPVPKPFGQSRHHIWSWSSESNTRRRGTSSLHFHCARPANFWSWHAASNCGLALTVRLLFPLSYTSGAGAAIRTPITDLRGPRSSH